MSEPATPPVRIHDLGRTRYQPVFDAMKAFTEDRGPRTPDEIWRRYFETLADAARSGLFDILAHPDLVKVWGRARQLPSRDLRFFYEPAIEAIAAHCDP